MYKRYFRMKDPACKPERIEWIEMSGSEFYRFVNSPEGQNRHFIDMDDVVLETSEVEARSFRSEKNHRKNHRYYIQTRNEDWNTVSLYTTEVEDGCSGEELVRDETQDVEAEVIRQIETAALQQALIRLDPASYRLIYALYLADEQKTERELALEYGVSQVAVHKQKKKILKTIKFLVIKTGKSQQ